MLKMNLNALHTLLFWVHYRWILKIVKDFRVHHIPIKKESRREKRGGKGRRGEGREGGQEDRREEKKTILFEEQVEGCVVEGR